MSAAPAMPLADGAALPLPLLLRWLVRLRRAGVTRIAMPQLPHGNGWLPDALALAGITNVDAELPGGWSGLTWFGFGGGRVAIGSGGPRHVGSLPSSAEPGGLDAAALHALIDLARLEDAAAVAAGSAGTGAAWDAILAAAGLGHAPRLRPGLHTDPDRHDSTDANATRFAAWNPLPFARQALVALPAGRDPAPWAVVTSEGQRLPLQVADGAFGREWLVSLPFGALACRTLTAHHEPVAGALFEVTPSVLDNGIVRVEFDAVGRIVRLCLDGVFAELDGPALEVPPALALPEAAVVTVLEAGPVRGRVAIARRGPAGVLHVTCTLHAHEDILRIAASWTGRDPILLTIPTAQHRALLRCCGDGGSWTMSATADAFAAPSAATPSTARTLQRGVRVAALTDADGRGLAVCAARPLVLRCDDGGIDIGIEGAAQFALAAAKRPPGTASLGCIAASLAIPARSRPADVGAVAAPFRLADLGGLVPLWVRRPDGEPATQSLPAHDPEATSPGAMPNMEDASALVAADAAPQHPEGPESLVAPAREAHGELLLVEQHGRAGRAVFFPAVTALAAVPGVSGTPAQTTLSATCAAWRCDALGNPLRHLPRTPEGDGFHLDYQPGEILLVRWTI